jgi:hypothetical protein
VSNPLDSEGSTFADLRAALKVGYEADFPLAGFRRAHKTLLRI